MNTLTLTAIVMVLYAMFETCTARAGGRIDPAVSAFIFNGPGAVVPLVALFVIRGLHHGYAHATREGYMYSILAGLAVASLSSASHQDLLSGGALSFVFPTILGGAIALAAAIGWVILKGSLSLAHVLGVALIVAGIGLTALPH